MRKEYLRPPPPPRGNLFKDKDAAAANIVAIIVVGVWCQGGDGRGGRAQKP